MPDNLTQTLQAASLLLQKLQSSQLWLDIPDQAQLLNLSRTIDAALKRNRNALRMVDREVEDGGLKANATAKFTVINRS